MKTPLAYFMLISSLILFGCNTSPAPITSSGGSNTTVTVTDSKIPSKGLCELLKAEDVSTILGQSVTSHESAYNDSKSRRACNYVSDESGKTISLNIIATYDSNFQSAKEGYEAALDGQKQIATDTGSDNITEISGVGDRAFLNSSAVGAVVTALRQNVWVEVNLTYGADLDAQSEYAKKIANRALEVL